MNYTVHWDLHAVEQMFRVWISTEDVTAAATATNQINSLLASDPEPPDSREHEGIRLLTVGPMRIAYEVHHHERRVAILGVSLLID